MQRKIYLMNRYRIIMINFVELVLRKLPLSLLRLPNDR